MTRRRIVTIGAVVGGVPAIVLLCLVLYLRFADLSGWQNTVAEKVSQSLGRKVTIAGEFKPEIGLRTRLTAGDITLANPGWSSDTTMASVRRLSVELDLWSLVSGPLTIHDVEIEGARVLLEKGADGRANWVFGTASQPTASKDPLELVLQHVLVDDVQLSWREPSRTAPLEAEITNFETTEDHAGMLEVEYDGTVDRRDVQIAGRIGTLAGLLNAGAVEFDLTGTLDGVQFASKGDIKELKTIGGVEVVAEVHGEDLDDLRGLFKLPPELGGPFSLSAAVSPSAAGADVQLNAAVAGITAKLAGTVDSLVKPKILDASVTASGPSIRTVGALTGITDLPDDAFSVSGGVRWEGFPITFKKVEITVGDNTLSADGELGAPPEMMGSDFSLQGKGPDLSTIGALAGVDLPREDYSVRGRVVRVEGGLEIEDTELRVGRTVIRVDGRVGDTPNHAGTTLSIHAEGPNLALFDRLVGAQLPGQPFVIDGRLAPEASALTLDGVTAQVGSTKLRADGTLKMVKRLVGSSLRIEAKGSDATDLKILAGLKDLPDEAWTARGGVTIIDAGLQLDGASVSVGSLRADGDGRLSTTKGLVGTDLQLHAEDPDLSHAMPIFGVSGFPRVPASANGRLRVEAGAFGLDDVTGSAGDIDVAVDGVIGSGSDLDGTRARLSVHGPRASSLGPYFRLDGLPPAPFSVTGDVQIDESACTFTDVVAEVDRNHLTINGTVMPVKGLVGTDVQIEMSAPDLGQAGRLAAGFTKLSDLPAEPLTLATHLNIDEAGYEFSGLRATLDQAVASVDGRVGAAPGLVGTNLSVTADGPNASLFSVLTGATVPVAPFKISGRIARTEDLVVFDHVAVRLGGHAVDLHGSLGEKPHLIGTDLDLHVSGPGTGLIEDLTGFDKLPDEPFAIGGYFNGTPEKFTAKNLEITLGESDLGGSLEVDIRGKPQVTAKLSSRHIEYGELAPRLPSQGDEGPGPQTATHKSKTGLVFSEKPIDFGWLRRADADVDLTIGTLQMPVERFHDFELEARLVDGRLDIYRIAMVGSREGHGSGTLVLEPFGDSYRAELDLVLNAIRFDLAGEDVPDSAAEPPVDFEVRLQAQGTSPHGFASSSNGSIQVIAGRGVMDNRVLNMITADVLLTLLHAFNPFAKENVATELECAVILITFDQGLATLEPMALQSNKMTMLGSGRIDLGTEKLNLNWVTKPRKGIGISASMITNPYIKLGGTLGHPVIELKPMQAIASTGAAVATLGISWVAKGMLDRATAEKKVCKQALEEIAKADKGN